MSRAAAADSEQADFWVSVDAAELLPALVSAGRVIFKERAHVLANPK